MKEGEAEEIKYKNWPNLAENTSRKTEFNAIPALDTLFLEIFSGLEQRQYISSIKKKINI